MHKLCTNMFETTCTSKVDSSAWSSSGLSVRKTAGAVRWRWSITTVERIVSSVTKVKVLLAKGLIIGKFLDGFCRLFNVLMRLDAEGDDQGTSSALQEPLQHLFESWRVRRAKVRTLSATYPSKQRGEGRVDCILASFLGHEAKDTSHWNSKGCGWLVLVLWALGPSISQSSNCDDILLATLERVGPRPTLERKLAPVAAFRKSLWYSP